MFFGVIKNRHITLYFLLGNWQKMHKTGIKGCVTRLTSFPLSLMSWNYNYPPLMIQEI